MGIWAATQDLAEEVRRFLFHCPDYILVRLLYRRSRDLRIHAGCGPCLKPGWVNIDLRREAEIRLDLRRPFPFPPGSATIVYAEHFLEHLDYPDCASDFLRECRRVLKPGGILSLVVPDIELVLRSTVLGGTPQYYDAQRCWHPPHLQTQIEHVNYNFRQDGEHRYSYDFETLSRLLTHTGFTEITRREYDPDLDRGDRRVGSLYVRATRP